MGTGAHVAVQRRRAGRYGADVGNRDETRKAGHSSKFDVEALAERWHQIFATMPPFGDTPPAPTQPVEPDGPLPTMRDVVKITTMSKTTIKQCGVSDNDNDFPKPVKLSPRRIGWRKKDVVAWLEQRR